MNEYYKIEGQTLSDVADKVRTYTGATNQIKAKDLDTCVDNVYEAGKKAEYDRFWDIYQENGKRKHYMNAFSGIGWGNDTFKPKYDLIPINAYMLFRESNIVGDLTKILKDLGISLSFSNCTNNQYAFYSSKFTKIGLVDFDAVTSTAISAFGYCSDLESVEIKVNENTVFNQMWTNCTALINLVIHGTIGQNGFNVKWSTLLSHDSLMSIINALQDKTGDTSGTSWVCTLGTENLAKLSDAEKAIATEKGWSLA